VLRKNSDIGRTTVKKKRKNFPDEVDSWMISSNHYSAREASSAKEMTKNGVQEWGGKQASYLKKFQQKTHELEMENEQAEKKLTKG